MTHFQLARAATPTRFLITLFLFFLLLGYVVATLYAYERTGLRLDGTRLRYEGAAEDEETEELYFPMSRDELLRLTHVHTLGMAMMFYLFGHVFILTQARVRTKMFWLGAFFLALLSFIAAPWGVKYVSSAFGYVYLGSIGALWLVVAVLMAIPIHEMWFRQPRPRTDEAKPPADNRPFDL